MAAPQIAQRCRLPLRQVQSGLATLVQLRLVYCHQPLEGMSTYEPNDVNAYNLIRTGQLIQLAEDTEGHKASQILQQLALLGYSTVSELEAHFLNTEASQPQKDDKNHTQTNGNGDAMLIDGPERSDRTFKASLRGLIDNKFICRLRKAHFLSPFDAKQKIEREMFPSAGTSSTRSRKAQLDIEERIHAEYLRQMDSTLSSHDVLNELASSGLPDPAGRKSQVCLDRSVLLLVLIKDKILLCIDYSNSLFVLRNRALVSLATSMLSSQAALVLHALSRQIEIEATGMKTLAPDAPVSNERKRIDIDQVEHDTAKGAGTVLLPLGHSRNGWSSSQIPNGHESSRVNGFHTHINVQDQLAILSETHFSFIEHDPNSRAWYVDKSGMDQFLRSKEMMRIIEDDQTKHGPSLRILRMLSDKGKLDEKSLQEIGLLGAKDLRKCLGHLQASGLLELQEVPREPQRQPNRTIFLWFYDADRVQKVLLNRLYKSMCRLFQRLHIEREKLSALLSHLERADVARESLAAKQLEELSELRQKESWFISEIQRLDHSVTILRDL